MGTFCPIASWHLLGTLTLASNFSGSARAALFRLHSFSGEGTWGVGKWHLLAQRPLRLF